MDFKYRLGETVFCINNFKILKCVVESITIKAGKIAYILYCDNGENAFYRSLEEEEIYSDYEFCKKELITTLRKMIKDLN